jgi:hypothetical protein
MKDLMRMFEAIWISVAFAEAGEQKTAREFMGPELCDAENAETCHAM